MKYYLQHMQTFLDDDVNIVMSYFHRTQSICVLFSPPVICHNLHKIIKS